MTKIARLADGRELPFPDDLPDEEMHARVREHLTGEAARAEDVGLAGQRNRLLMALGQQIGQLGTVVADLSAQQAATQRLLAQVAGAIERLQGGIDGAAARIEAAVMSTVVQTIERDEDGRIRSTTLRRGGEGRADG